MANHISFVLPCESRWVEGIYQLERTDPVRGYDPETGQDGISNRQYLELGNRTLYLKNLLDAEHVEGHHSLRNNDFLVSTKIPEQSLLLHYSTNDLHRFLNELRAGVETEHQHLLHLNNVNGSYAAMLALIVPYCREYFHTNCDYELFTDAVRFRQFGYTDITSTIAGDDSIDVADTDGIEVGRTYYIVDNDGGRAEEVVIRSVLTKTRLRCTQTLRYTRSSGKLGATTMLPINGVARVKHGFTYISGEIDMLRDAPGRLYIHRDNVTTTKTVSYRMADSTTWVRADFVETQNFMDGTVDDVFALPAGNMQLKIVYESATADYNLYYFVIQALRHLTLIEDVRQPVIQSVRRDGAYAEATGNAYASLWDIPQSAMELRVFPVDEYDLTTSSALLRGRYTTGRVLLSDALLTTTSPLRIQVRYSDAEGTWSRWSPAVELQM